MALLFLLSLVTLFTCGMIALTTRGVARLFFVVLLLVACVLFFYALVNMFLAVLPQ